MSTSDDIAVVEARVRLPRMRSFVHDRSSRPQLGPLSLLQHGLMAIGLANYCQDLCRFGETFKLETADRSGNGCA